MNKISKNSGFSRMFLPTIIMGLIALGLLILGYRKGGGEHIQGLELTGNLLLQITPLLIFAFIIAGMIRVLIPTERMSRLVGVESGFRGVLIGTITGSITPMVSPYVSYPITAGILRAGASIGTGVAFLTAWALLAVLRMPLEVGILGWKFLLMRLACVFSFPLIAGLLANLFFSRTDVLRDKN